MNGKNENDPNLMQEMNTVETAEPRARAVPNIPRREPDSLPERPEREKSSALSSGLMILLALAVILILVFVFRGN